MNNREAGLLFADQMDFFEESHSDLEWDAFFYETLVKLEEHPETFGKFAVILCQQWIFKRCLNDEGNFDDVLLMAKLTMLAKSIFSLGASTPMMTANFFRTFFVFDRDDLLRPWWEQSYADKMPGFTHEAYLIGVLEHRYFHHDTWTSAFEFLEPHLDHKSDFVRASAAGALGHLCKDGLEGMPPLLELFDDIKARELKRPGVAGPFWFKLQNWLESDEESELEVDLDPLEWLLEILENRVGEEPEHPGYNDVEYLAYTLAGDDVDAIRRLFKLGAYNRVYDLAFEFSQFSDEFKDLLIEMGNSDDYHMQTTASCLLAYEYKYLHPNCERLGRIQEFDLEDATIIMIYGKKVPLLAAAIHPKQGILTDSIAWKWINNLLPPDDRQGDWEPEIEDDTIIYGGEDRTVVLYGNVHDKLWDKVVIKTPTRNVVID